MDTYCFFNIVLISILYIYQKYFYNSEILCHKLNLLINKIYLYVVITTEFKFTDTQKNWLTLAEIFCTLADIFCTLSVPHCTFYLLPLYPAVPFCTILRNSSVPHYWLTDFHCIRLYATVQSTDNHCTPMCATESFLKVKPSI